MRFPGVPNPRYQVIRGGVRGHQWRIVDIKDGHEITWCREMRHFFLQYLLPPGFPQAVFLRRREDQASPGTESDGTSRKRLDRLGIEMVRRLRTVRMFISRGARGLDDSSSRLDEVMLDHGRLDQELAEAREQVAELRTRFDGQERTAERAQQRFVATGGDVSLRVGELRGEREQLNRRQGLLLARIREGSGALWPLTCGAETLNARALHTESTHSDLRAWPAECDPRLHNGWRGAARYEEEMDDLSQRDFEEVLRRPPRATFLRKPIGILSLMFRRSRAPGKGSGRVPRGLR